MLFILSRVKKSDIPFHEPIPKMKLSAFAFLSLSKVKIGGKEVILKADRHLFARLVIGGPVLRNRPESVILIFPWSCTLVSGVRR